MALVRLVFPGSAGSRVWMAQLQRQVTQGSAVNPVTLVSRDKVAIQGSPDIQATPDIPALEQVASAASQALGPVGSVGSLVSVAIRVIQATPGSLASAAFPAMPAGTPVSAAGQVIIPAHQASRASVADRDIRASQDSQDFLASVAAEHQAIRASPARAVSRASAASLDIRVTAGAVAIPGSRDLAAFPVTPATSRGSVDLVESRASVASLGSPVIQASAAQV